METLVVGALQMTSQQDKGANLEKASRLIDEAARRGARFVGLPEFFNYIGPDVKDAAEPIGGDTTTLLQQKARTHGIWIHGGSIPECSPNGRVYNCTPVVSPSGDLVATYRKVHLFDVEVPGQPEYKESASISPGANGAVFETPWGTMGLTICYDLRFGELHRCEALAGARVLWSPAAFTLYTGKDHWEVLVRARAIENQVFMICPAQVGTDRRTGRSYFGSTMIVDPWGTVIARADEREGVVIAGLDFGWQEEVRQRIPSLQHRRPGAYRV